MYVDQAATVRKRDVPTPAIDDIGMMPETNDDDGGGGSGGCSQDDWR